MYGATVVHTSRGKIHFRGIRDWGDLFILIHTINSCASSECNQLSNAHKGQTHMLLCSMMCKGHVKVCLLCSIYANITNIYRLYYLSAMFLHATANSSCLSLPALKVISFHHCVVELWGRFLFASTQCQILSQFAILIQWNWPPNCVYQYWKTTWGRGGGHFSFDWYAKFCMTNYQYFNHFSLGLLSTKSKLKISLKLMSL